MSTESEVFCAATPSWAPPYIALARVAGLETWTLPGGFPQKKSARFLVGLGASGVVRLRLRAG